MIDGGDVVTSVSPSRSSALTAACSDRVRPERVAVGAGCRPPRHHSRRASTSTVSGSCRCSTIRSSARPCRQPARRAGACWPAPTTASRTTRWRSCRRPTSGSRWSNGWRPPRRRRLAARVSCADAGTKAWWIGLLQACRAEDLADGVTWRWHGTVLGAATAAGTPATSTCSRCPTVGTGCTTRPAGPTALTSCALSCTPDAGVSRRRSS